MGAVPHHVILGGGIAGHHAALTLREVGFDGRVTMIGAENIVPYDRTALSKGFLLGTRALDSLRFQSPERYAHLGIDLLLGTRATAVDFNRRLVTLDTGENIGFTHLLIATGATPVRLRQPGFDLPGVHYLRTLADAEGMRAQLAGAERVLVVGAGFVGCEVAATTRMLGRQVTLADPLPVPMMGVLGEQIGRVYGAIHRRHGVDLRMGSAVVELRGHGRVEEAVLGDGTRIPCDLVAVGVGVRPRVSIFSGAALKIDDGIVVDEFCATTIPGVYAAGDVAQWWHPGAKQFLRVEHFDNAARQGAAAARNMAGQHARYAPVPYFWSDQYNINLQSLGHPGAGDQLVVRGDLEEASFTVFFLRQGYVQGAVIVNRTREARPARRLIEVGARLEPAALADPATDLRALAKQFDGFAAQSD